jgi:hypothetical protein
LEKLIYNIVQNEFLYIFISNFDAL